MDGTRRVVDHGWVAAGVLLLVPVLSGCLAPDAEVPLYEAPVHAFEAVYEGEMSGIDRIEVSFTGPENVLGPAGQLREAHSLHLRWEGNGSGHGRTDGNAFFHYDGDFRLVRKDSWFVDWTADMVPKFGFLWPVLIEERPEGSADFGSVVRDGDSFRVEDRFNVYHYERGEPIPFLIERTSQERGELYRVDYAREGAMPQVGAWPVPENATGERELLFPGAEEPWFSHPVSYKELFEGLMEHSESVREMIGNGGCVDGLVHHPPERRPYRTVLGEPVGGDVVVHRTEFSVLAPPDPESSGGGLGTSGETLLSPYPGVKGERWQVTVSQDPLSQGPLSEDSVEYEQIQDGAVGYMECDEIDDLGRPVSLQDAWERVESVPVEWDPERMRFSWRLGFSDHGLSVPERFRFEILEEQEDGPPQRRTDLRMDAQKGAFMEFSADEDVRARLDG